MAEFISKLSEYSQISEKDILSVAKNSFRLYRTFRIKKRNGGVRIISEPSPTLKRLQQCVAELIIDKYPVSQYSTAYERGNKTFLNAKKHIHAQHILKTDIKGFFMSVNYGHFSSLLSPAYNEKDIKLMWDIVSYCGGLPMGAPSSPAISNRVMYGIDMKIAAYLKETALKGAGFWDKLFGSYVKPIYTRYSDDITISCTERIDKELLGGVSKILQGGGFVVNNEKTRFKGPGQQKRITGVIVENGTLSLGTKFKKELKKKIYDRLTKKKGSVERIKGLITYAESIEPHFAFGLRAKYKKLGYFEVFYPHGIRRRGLFRNLFN